LLEQAQNGGATHPTMIASLGPPGKCQAAYLNPD
jgi:hypothetical protein